MREHHRSPKVSGIVLEEEHQLQNEDDESSQSGVVKIGSDSVIVAHGGLDEFVASDVATRLALANPAPLAAPIDPESLPTREFQVTLRADQLARLWLREPTLMANNVFAWSNEKGKWVPAVSLSDVSREITRARVDRVRMLSVLNAARKSVTVLPPSSSRSRVNNLLGPGVASSAELMESGLTRTSPPALVPTENEPASPTARELGRTLVALLMLLGDRAIHWLQRLRDKGSALLNAVQDSFHPMKMLRANWLLAIICSAIVTIVPLGIRQAHSLSAAAKGSRSLSAMENLPSLNVRQLAPVVISAASGPDTRVAPAEQAKAPKSEKSGLIAVSSSPDAERKSYRPSVSRERPTANPSETKTKSGAQSSTGIWYAPFDASVAGRAINQAAARTSECTDGDVYGSVTLTFFPSGYARNVQVGLFTGDDIQRICITDLFQKVRVAPFGGAPVTVRRNFHSAVPTARKLSR